MNRKHFCALAVLFASVLCKPVAAEVAIGFANPLSGDHATSGQRNRAAVMMAVEDLNANGGVLGQKLRLVEADDACDLEQAVEAAHRLVAAGVRLVVGHMCSHASLMAAGIYEAFDVLMITPDSTHPRLTQEGRRNVFRLTGRDDRQGALAGDFLARAFGDEDIAIVHDGTVYGRGLAVQARHHLWQNDVVETLFAGYVPGKQDYGALVERLRDANIDVLYVGGYGADAGRILRTAHEQGLDLQLVGGDGLVMQEFWDVAGEAGEGTIFSARPTVRGWSDPDAARVAARLRRQGPGVGGIAAYAAIELWARAVERAGTWRLPVVTAELRRGRFYTVLGEVAFDDNGDLRGAGWEMQVWHRGDYRPLDRRTSLTSTTSMTSTTSLTSN